MKLILILLMGIVSFNLFAMGDIAKGKAKSTACVACHGATGNSTSDGFPKIAGQHQGYIFKQLKDFKSQKRKDGTMFGMVAGLSETDMQNIAAFYASQTTSRNVAKKDAKMLKLGEQLYRGGKVSAKTTACVACHGVKGQGIPTANFPRLSFQHAAYTNKQLKNFRQESFDTQQNKVSANTRKNDPTAMMRATTKHLTNKEIEALSQYIAGLH
jgi:cytochrome c553